MSPTVFSQGFFTFPGAHRVFRSHTGDREPPRIESIFGQRIHDGFCTTQSELDIVQFRSLSVLGFKRIGVPGDDDSLSRVFSQTARRFGEFFPCRFIE